MLSGDLPRTAELALPSGEEGLRTVGFELFRPILPMLASTAETVTEAMEPFELASVEWKLDGIRIQIHRRGKGRPRASRAPRRRAPQVVQRSFVAR
jgi:DNA ligase-1